MSDSIQTRFELLDDRFRACDGDAWIRRLHTGCRWTEGPAYFPLGQASDQPEHVVLAELIREQVLARARQEVPHSVEVQIEDVEEGERLTTIRALVWVETESQKGILIGAGGRMVKAIGTAARKELERRLGQKVHLELSVRVRRRWRADDALLDRLGID